MTTETKDFVVFWVFALVGRFTSITLICAYITAILTNHLGYDTAMGALMLVLAAVSWTFANLSERYGEIPKDQVKS